MSFVQRWDALVEESLARRVPPHLQRRPPVLLRHERADVLVGMRRSGKTYGLWETVATRLATGMPREHALFLNLEDDRLGEPTAATLDGLLEAFYRQVPAARVGPCLLCFDEIQAASGWERFVRRVLDTEQAHVLLSGSSAKLLSTEIATSLRGRAWTVEVFPYDFAETVRHQGRDALLRPGPLSAARRSELAQQARRYLEVGGFPEVQDLAEPARRQILREYVDVVLLRDVIERHGASNAAALRQLARRLLANTGCMFSVHRFANDLRSQGVRVAKDTVYAYFDHLCDAYLVHAVAIDSRSERERHSNPRKVYANDPGLALNFQHQPQRSWGALLETWAFLQLRRHYRDIAYVRTPRGYEVDFIVRDAAHGTTLVQVCADLDDPGTRTREVRALADARAAYPEATMVLVTMDTDEVIDVGGQALRTTPVWRWALPHG